MDVQEQLLLKMICQSFPSGEVRTYTMYVRRERRGGGGLLFSRGTLASIALVAGLSLIYLVYLQLEIFKRILRDALDMY